jgi:hypothetical protein
MPADWSSESLRRLADRRPTPAFRGRYNRAMSEPPKKLPSVHVPGINATADMILAATKPHGFHSARQVRDAHEAMERIREDVPDQNDQRDDFDALADTMREMYAKHPPVASSMTFTIPAGMKLQSARLSQTLAAVSSVAPTYQQTSIKNLEPVFKKFTDLEVQVYAKDDQPIGPRIGVADVPESTLKAIAGVEVERRVRISDRAWYIVGGLLLAVATGIGAWITAKMTGS